MRFTKFSSRTVKEILRDPLNLAFALGFPLAIIVLLNIINKSIPSGAPEIFELKSLTPGIAVFGLSFITLFSATLISKDRASSLIKRLFASPMTAADFILGYTLPLIPISLGQAAVCYTFALILGLDFSVNIFYAILFVLPISPIFISAGLLCGSVFNDKQVGGICGAILTNLTAWLSGAWFDIELVGGWFEKIAEILPFIHAVRLERAVIAGNFGGILPDILWILGYGILLTAAAIFAFTKKMKNN